MSFVIWTYILGGATLFGVIVGVFSVWNGRVTRREISRLIASETEQTRNLIEHMQTETQKILERNTAALERLASR